MKYVTTILIFILCIIGVVATVMMTRDTPQYADGEPTAIVKDWLQKQPPALSSATQVFGSENNNTLLAGISSENGEQDKIIWTEEYLGSGKWMVSKATLPSEYSETNLTFEEWISKTKGWNASRLKEYESDLSPEARETYQEQLRTYSPGQQLVNIIEKWYIYEKSGLVEKVQD